MQISILSINAHPGDAIGTDLYRKFLFFQEQGHTVRVFVEDDTRTFPALRPFLKRRTAVDFQAGDYAFLENSDLIWVHFGQTYSLLGVLPRVVDRRARIVFDYHGVTPPQACGAFLKDTLEKSLRHKGYCWLADAVVVHSAFAQGDLVQATGFPSHEVYRIGYAIDSSPDHEVRPAAGPAQRSRPFRILFVGRVAPNKRLETLVRALPLLADVEPAVHVQIAGEIGGAYEPEALKIQDLARQLQVADRVHVLGRLEDGDLQAGYRSADLVVLPSCHESFCLPALEAMAAGVPVIGARAAALPETIGSAGLTFTLDDPADLARQIRRVLMPRPLPTAPARPRRVAIVSPRFGPELAGGAEQSLLTIGQALQQAGFGVDVCTTCNRAEAAWDNILSAGHSSYRGLPVQRFRIDAHDRDAHLASVQQVARAGRPVPRDAEARYLRHSIHSADLLDALRDRQADYDAIFVGPYLYGLTYDVARAFPGLTVLVPCFHDEPFARLQLLREAYEQVGAILYHSPEEQQFAEAVIGLNHPGAILAGTCLDMSRTGDPDRGRRIVGADQPYVVYCGRYSPQKNLPEFLAHLQGFQEEHPGRLGVVFMGQGEMALPERPWLRNLGFVDEQTRCDVLAGAAALVQPSLHESLSLVALEAWAQRTPVLADRRCTVLAGQLGRSGGGLAVEGPAQLAAALLDLLDRPEHWRALGQSGWRYVRDCYGSPGSFADRLKAVIEELPLPLAAKMRRQGRIRAAGFAVDKWQQALGQMVDDLVHRPRRPVVLDVAVQTRFAERSVAAGLGTILVPVQLINRGSHAVAAEGPGRFVVRSQVLDAAGQPCGPPGPASPLPGLLMPDRPVSAAVAVVVPATPGSYRAAFWVEPAEPGWFAHPTGPPPQGQLSLEAVTGAGSAACCAPLIDSIQTTLARADHLHRLPDSYVDVTAGWFAGLKRWIKRKVLNNFRKAYVDELSRQQSSFNQQVVAALTELTECCAALDHAQSTERLAMENGDLRSEVAALQAEVAQMRQIIAEMHAGLPAASVPQRRPGADGRGITEE